MIASTKSRVGFEVINPRNEPRKPIVGPTLTGEVAVQRMVQLLNEAVALGALPAL